ncbi:MAG: 50S ribosomal protein L21 [bacterium JZ-2024 1]
MVMRAIVEIGGEQYLVGEGEEVVVEKLSIPVGEEFIVNEVLMVLDGSRHLIGFPYVEGFQARCVHQQITQGKKVKAIRFKPYTGLKKIRGHRQSYSIIRVLALEEVAKGGS